MFDEDFALDQIYIPLNAWHSIEKSQSESERRESRRAVNLTADMLAWLRGERTNHRLRIVTGGPGSGKSSVMKALAAELTEYGNRRNPTDVLMFPMQRFQWRTGIVESVDATLKYADQMRHNPLSSNSLRNRDIPLLLIFDGLDELSVSTEISEAIAATFLRELSTALRSWEGRPIRAIVTGRDAVFGHVEGSTNRPPGQRLHLLPYHIRKLESDLPSRRAYYDPEDLLCTDFRVLAFQRYARARGEAPESVPTVYSHDDSHDVSAQPLLNYFLLTAGTDNVVDRNVARIYSRLFERLHARNRNVDNRSQDEGKPGSGLSQELFDRVFEAMAVAAWRTGGARSASWPEVLAEADREDSYLGSEEETLRAVFDSHRIDHTTAKPYRLAAAFFIRNQQATGVEFTHKSFGDYLYARRLSKALVGMTDALVVLPAAILERLHRWEALTAEQRMSNEARRFLELEVEATVNKDTLNRRLNILSSEVERVFRDGWVAGRETSGRRAEMLSSQMEEALFVAWHALWKAIDNHRRWKLGENTGDLLRRALARQESAHGIHAAQCSFVVGPERN